MKTIIFLSIVMTLAASSAVGQDVRYNFDKNSDFSKFKTYRWVTLKDAAKPNDLAAKQIIAAVDAELATKGLSRVDGDNADLYIGYQAALTRRRNLHPSARIGDMGEAGMAEAGTVGWVE